MPNTISFTAESHYCVQEEAQFLRQTYLVFLISVLTMSVCGFVSYRLVPRSSMEFLCAADAVIWFACGWFDWRKPVVLSLGLFTVITGLILGQVAHYSPTVLAMCSLLGLIAFGGLLLHAHRAPHRFSFQSGFLHVLFFIVLGGCALLLFAGERKLYILLCQFGVLAFVCWILLRTGHLLENRDDEVTPGVAALEMLIFLLWPGDWFESLKAERDI